MNLFLSKEDLQKHIQLHSSTNSAYYLKCEYCEKMCITQYQLQIHKRSHNTKQFKEMPCPICNKVFKLKSKFESHLKTHESIPGDETRHSAFACVHCDKKFSKQYDLGRHLKSHLGIKSHCCNECGAKFVDTTRLKQHMWIHRDIKG